LLTLFVGIFTKSALDVTFALLSGRLISWVLLPLFGRISDETSFKLGRRVPLIFASLTLMGICLYLLPESHNYLTVLALIALAKIGSTLFSLASFSVVPEVMGRKKWISSYILIFFLAVVLSGTTKLNALLSWHQGQTSSYGHVFHYAGIVTVISAVVVLLTVKEPKLFLTLAKRDKAKAKNRAILKNAAELLKSRNSKVLLGGALLFWMGTGATSSLTALFLETNLKVSAQGQILLGVFLAAGSIIIGLPLGIMLALSLQRKTVAVLSPLAGSLAFFAVAFSTKFWQLLIIALLGSPLIFAYLSALGRFYLLLVPPEGGLAERLGIFSAPFSFVSTLGAFSSAILVDAFGTNYRFIWLIPAVCGIFHGLIMTFLKVEPQLKKLTYNDLLTIIKNLKQSVAKHRKDQRQAGGFFSYLFKEPQTADEIDATKTLDSLRSYYASFITSSEENNFS